MIIQLRPVLMLKIFEDARRLDLQTYLYLRKYEAYYSEDRTCIIFSREQHKAMFELTYSEYL